MPRVPGQLRKKGERRGLKRNILIVPQEEFLINWLMGAQELNGKVKGDHVQASRAGGMCHNRVHQRVYVYGQNCS